MIEKVSEVVSRYNEFLLILDDFAFSDEETWISDWLGQWAESNYVLVDDALLIAENMKSEYRRKVKISEDNLKYFQFSKYNTQQMFQIRLSAIRTVKVKIVKFHPV